MMGQVRAKSSAALAQEKEDRMAAGFGNPDSIEKKETYVPDSTHGSPRHMAALAKNALVLVSEWGCPHIFLTLTCNPDWPEITSQLLVSQSAFDRPDVVRPVFKAQLDQFKHNIRHGKYFEGCDIAYMLHVLEYQFCGLPHVHMVIRLMNCFDIDDDDSDGLINFVNRNFVAKMPRFAGEEYQNVFQKEGEPSFNDVNFELDEMPVYLLQCIPANSSFSKDCSIYNNLLAMAATKVCNYSETLGWMQRGPGSASVTLNGRVYHYFPTADSSDPSCGLSFFIFDDDTAQAGSASAHNVDQLILCTLGEGLKLHNPYCINLRQLGLEARERRINSRELRNIIPTMQNQP